ncbi:hypothetical protein KR222_000761, partial [Zaprionus bogoriensis]
VADEIQKNEPEDILEEVLKLVRNKLPNDTIHVHPFGSRVMGVAAVDSDLDIYIELSKLSGYNCIIVIMARTMQNTIRSAFYLQKNWYHIDNRGGRCPIVCVRYKPTNLQCDISFSNSMTLGQNKLVKYLFQIQPIARYMVIFLRGWTKRRNLGTAFRSHILILMVIFFLQIQNHLPGINKLQENLVPSPGPWVESFRELELSTFKMLKLNVCETKTRELLKEFFKFYSKFEFNKYAICPYLGQLVLRLGLASKMP